MKLVVLVILLLLNIFFVWKAAPAQLLGHAAALWDRTSGPVFWAFLLPLVSWGVFLLVWLLDKPLRGDGLRDRSSHSSSRGKTSYDYAASAITRQSIHTAMSVFLIRQLLDLPVWDTPLAAAAIAALAIGVAFSLTSVLCYAYSQIWQNDTPLRKDLAKKGHSLDQLAWYALLPGLIWAAGIESPALSIIVNLLLTALLWFFYFKWPKKGDDPLSKLNQKLAAGTTGAETVQEKLEKSEHCKKFSDELKESITSLREAQKILAELAPDP